jgi:hypothetical protein
MQVQAPAPLREQSLCPPRAAAICTRDRHAARTHGAYREITAVSTLLPAPTFVLDPGVFGQQGVKIFFSPSEKNRAGILISSVSPVQNEAKIENSVKWHRIKVLKKLSEHFFSIFLLNILSETGGSIVITRNCQRISRIAFGRDHQQRWKPPRGNEFLVSSPCSCHLRLTVR